MCPSAKKKHKNRVVSKVEDEKLQDKTKQPMHKGIERNRLKMVLRNLSLLKLLKSSNRRIQELHNLARRCWNSMLRVPKLFCGSSRENDVRSKKRQNNEEPQDAMCFKKNLESKQVEHTGEPEEASRNEWKSKKDAGISRVLKGSPAAVPRKEEQMEPDLSRKSRGHGLNTRAQRRRLPTRGCRVVFQKTYRYRTPMGDTKQLDVNGQYTWFEGLPTRIHIPGPRVMCRSSKLRWAKRRCTRLCSASLEVPMYRSYKSGNPLTEQHGRTLSQLRPLQEEPRGKRDSGSEGPKVV